MIHCFSKSAFLIGVFIFNLYIFDIAWVLLPDLAAMPTLLLTIGIVWIAFKLATISTNFLFQRFFSRHMTCSISSLDTRKHH
ncbi:MAG TPA: hypothetical protein VK120_07590 [Sporosarcina sp.]|nr:hypothetical protein [Sporosarcina sp.]